MLFERPAESGDARGIMRPIQQIRLTIRPADHVQSARPLDRAQPRLDRFGFHRQLGLQPMQGGQRQPGVQPLVVA
jgi:hypothetical protein